MSKIDKLKQATNTFNGLYIDNAPRQNGNINKAITDTYEDIKESNLKMVSLRLEQDFIKQVKQCAYMKRITFKEVLVRAVNEYLNKSDIKEIMSKYDETIENDK